MGSPTQEAQWVLRAQCGDREALELVLRSVYPSLLRYLQRLVGSTDAEDVLQETFWQAWRRADRYEAVRATPLVWLLLLARSRALDFLRRHGRPKSGHPHSM